LDGRNKLDKYEADVEKAYPRSIHPHTTSIKVAALAVYNTAVKSLSKYKAAKELRAKYVAEYNKEKSTYDATLKQYQSMKVKGYAEKLMAELRKKSQEKYFTVPMKAHADTVNRYRAVLKDQHNKYEQASEVRAKAHQTQTAAVVAQLAVVEGQAVEHMTRNVQIRVRESGVFAGTNYSPIKKCDSKTKGNMYGTWVCSKLIDMAAIIRAIHKYSYSSGSSANRYFGANGGNFLFVKYGDVKNRKQIRVMRIGGKSHITVHMEGEFEFPWTALARKTAALSATTTAKCGGKSACWMGLFSDQHNRGVWSALMSNTYSSAYWMRYYRMAKVVEFRNERDALVKNDLNMILKHMGAMMKYTYYTAKYAQIYARTWGRYCTLKSCSYYSSSITKDVTIMANVNKYAPAVLKAFHTNNEQVQTLNRMNHMFQSVRSITLSFHTTYSVPCSSLTSVTQRRYRCGGDSRYSGYNDMDHVSSSAMWISPSKGGSYFTGDAGDQGYKAKITYTQMNYVSDNTFYGKEYKLETVQQDFNNGNNGLQEHTKREDNDIAQLTHKGWESKDENDGVNSRGGHVSTGAETFDEFSKKFPDLFRQDK
jgi:hypothetical protein